MDKISLRSSSLARFRQTLKLDENQSKIAEAGKSEKASFGDMLNKSITEVNNSQATADDNIAKYLSGQQTGLHETMLSLEKADISMRLMVQVRNKAVEAYREIMRMQV